VIDPSGNVWVANNWEIVAVPTNPGGHHFVVFVGLAAMGPSNFCIDSHSEFLRNKAANITSFQFQQYGPKGLQWCTSSLQVGTGTRGVRNNPDSFCPGALP
jgi:hypothetical protein